MTFPTNGEYLARFSWGDVKNDVKKPGVFRSIKAMKIAVNTKNRAKIVMFRLRPNLFVFGAELEV